MVIDGDKTLWLIEVTDYRSDAVEKDRSQLADVIVDKVWDTLAGLWCTQFTDTMEKRLRLRSGAFAGDCAR